MAEHARFEKLVLDAKKNIQEISSQETAAGLKSGDTLLIDVRDADEWQQGHIPGAKNFSRGTVELEIEEAAPDLSTPIITHCGGGGRSALTAESLQRMGYTNVKSMAGGFKAWKAAGLPTTKSPGASWWAKKPLKTSESKLSADGLIMAESALPHELCD